MLPAFTQQPARAGASEVPVAPAIALEPPELLAESRRDGALLTFVETGECVQQQRHGVSAERGRVPAVERPLGRRTRQVGADDKRVGIGEVQATEHGKPDRKSTRLT